VLKITVYIFFFFPVWLSAQDITGVWTGYIKTPGSQLEYELAISGSEKDLSGYSLIIYPKDGIENIGIKKAKIKQAKKEIYVEDGELVYDNFTTQPRRSKMFGKLSLMLKDTLMILRGSFDTRSLDFRDSRTYSGEVFLQKTARPLSSKMLVTMEEISLVHNFSFIKTQPVKHANNNNLKKETTGIIVKPPLRPTERKIQKISEINFSSDSLLLSFYDNGTIDGDTVTILLNGKILTEKLGLKANAFKITIPTGGLKSGDSLLLVMQAESLGLIPPNTGLLIIQDGTTRHEIRFEGDMQRSSAIMLKKKK